MAAEIAVVNNCLSELKIWSLHGIPFCGAWRTTKRLSGGSHPHTDEARRGAVRSPASVPRADGGRSSIEVRGSERKRSSRKPLPRTESLLVESWCRDAISNLL